MIKIDPTNSFTILELQNPSHDVPELHTIRESPDFEALLSGKGLLGIDQELACSAWTTAIPYLLSCSIKS